MAYSEADARRLLLEQLASAADEIGLALANLGEAYEQLDEFAAERLEDELFRPLGAAYGQAKRVHAEFAARHGLPAHPFEAAQPHVREHDARGIMERAAASVAHADGALGALQDSMLPVEVGDPQLRAGLEQVRTALTDIGPRTREIIRTLGR